MWDGASQLSMHDVPMTTDPGSTPCTPISTSTSPARTSPTPRASSTHRNPASPAAARLAGGGPRSRDTPTMATRVSSTRFVGRAAELAELEAAWRDAAAGRPSLAFVAGESGVGKSRLLLELERRVGADGARVLAGDCV